MDFNFIDILIKKYWIENRSFYIMSEGIIGKCHISDVPITGGLRIMHQCLVLAPPCGDKLIVTTLLFVPPTTTENPTVVSVPITTLQVLLLSTSHLYRRPPPMGIAVE